MFNENILFNIKKRNLYFAIRYKTTKFLPSEGYCVILIKSSRLFLVIVITSSFIC